MTPTTGAAGFTRGQHDQLLAWLNLPVVVRVVNRPGAVLFRPLVRESRGTLVWISARGAYVHIQTAESYEILDLAGPDVVSWQVIPEAWVFLLHPVAVGGMIA